MNVQEVIKCPMQKNKHILGKKMKIKSQSANIRKGKIKKCKKQKI